MTSRSGAGPTDQGFDRAFGEAKKQAENVTGKITDAAQNIRDSAADVADATTTAARKTAGSFEEALRNFIENQPYTAVAIGVGIGWLMGRTHRPF